MGAVSGFVRAVFFVAVAIGTLVHGGQRVYADEPDPVTTVKLTYEAPKSVVVELSMPLAWHRNDLPFVELELFAQQFKREGGLGQFIKLLDQSGSTRSFASRVEKPGDTLSLRYRVTLDHVAAEPANGPDDVPHPTKSGWWLTGRALLPTIRTHDGKRLDTRATIELVGFPGKLVSTLGDGAKLTAPSLEALRDAVYYSGDFLDEVIVPAGPHVRLLSSDFSATELRPLKTLIERTLQLATSRFGKPSQPNVLLIVDRNPWTFVEGGVVGNAVTLLVRDAPTGRASDLPGTVAVHELIHLWHRADQMWLGEGVTRYYEIMFRVLLDKLDRDGTIAELQRLWDRYGAEANHRVIRDDTSAWVYHGGALLALCADANLRLFGRGGPKHLDHLERIAELRDGSGQIISERWIGALIEMNVAAASELLAQRDAKGPIEVQRCFASIGYPAELTTYTGFTARALAVKILKVSGYSTQSNLVLKVLPDSMFVAGDTLRTCEGSKLHSVATLDWVLRDKKPGDSIQCTVERDRREVPLVLAMPTLEPTDRAWHQRVVFRSAADPNPNPNSKSGPKPSAKARPETALVEWPPR